MYPLGFTGAENDMTQIMGGNSITIHVRSSGSGSASSLVSLGTSFNHPFAQLSPVITYLPRTHWAQCIGLDAVPVSQKSKGSAFFALQSLPPLREVKEVRGIASQLYKKQTVSLFRVTPGPVNGLWPWNVSTMVAPALAPAQLPLSRGLTLTSWSA